MRLDTANIEFRIPAKAKQLGKIFVLHRVVALDIGHRGHDDKRILLAARLGDHETYFAKFNRFRHRVIEFLADPRRTIGSLPGDDVIILAQATSSAKVRVPLLMLAKTNIHTRLHQQRDHPVVPVEPIGHGHITFAEATEDLPKQCRLAGFFAFVTKQRFQE